MLAFFFQQQGPPTSASPVMGEDVDLIKSGCQIQDPETELMCELDVLTDLLNDLYTLSCVRIAMPEAQIEKKLMIVSSFAS